MPFPKVSPDVGVGARPSADARERPVECRRRSVPDWSLAAGPPRTHALFEFRAALPPLDASAA